MEHLVRRTLEAVVLTSLHPRTGITVVLQVPPATERLSVMPRSRAVLLPNPNRPIRNRPIPLRAGGRRDRWSRHTRDMVAEGGLVLGGWQVVHDDGAVLACAVNAAAAALVDAGVAMRGLVSAVCLTLTPSLTVLLDPVASELAVRLVRQNLRIQPI